MLTSLVASTHFRLVFPPTFPPKNNSTMCSAKRSNSLNSSGNMPDSAPARALKFQVQIEGPPENCADEEKPKLLQWKPRQLDKTIDIFSGKLLQGGLVFQQNFLIRSYELDPNGNVSILALVHHLQESSLNHFKSVGLAAEGFGLTAEMTRRNLVWVVYRTQIVVERLPTWDDVVQVETWISASGKHGHKRNSLIRDYKTGETLMRTTSLLLMMNKKTRKLSFVNEVWAEIEPHILNCDSIINKDKRKLLQLDLDKADYVRAGIAPLWNDLDVNQHVNHVKYINWILEGAPRSVMQSHTLSSMTLEYRKECGRDSMLQSLSAVNRSRDGMSHSTKNEGVELDHSLRLEDGFSKRSATKPIIFGQLKIN
ncbi:palmitoyl-acyl carrier protein thioesterase, chloroplastic-like [Alnus glutinosa]|uniref:palmitoyl-acyl carrier protein thioesterase, chloroplastic-like n=1 Tax=Alnus glutinosa TaxID=3517 RepID=UPI002D7A030C|nr:palmitoyl-acyl carrier protein thioesterase, chloroplastic-like [Alnus glutinosa]